MSKRRRPLLEAPELKGLDFTVAHTAAADRWFVDLFERAVTERPNDAGPAGLALVAVGGYGWGHLFPYSDLDVVLLHDGVADIGDVAERLWYPVWDRGLELGHVVATASEAVAVAGEELDRATAFLDTRLIAGDASLLVAFDDGIEALWRSRADDFLAQLAEVVDDRHRNNGDVAFMIEPNLKQGRGGIRDIQALRWASRAVPGFAVDLLQGLTAESELLFSARVELHRHANRPGDVVALDAQEDLAQAMAEPDAGALMKRLAEAGRRVAWNSDEAWERLRRRRVTTRREPTPLSDAFEVRDDFIELRSGVDVAERPLLLLEVADLAAQRDMAIGRATLITMASTLPPLPEPWSSEARDLLAAIFLAGAPAIDVVEDLDHFGLMSRILPEWKRVRCKPQRNVLHTFTVDRHLCQAAAYSAALADRVVRPDLLVVGSLLHDIGKGYSGDHTEVGMQVVQAIAERMGYAAEDVATLVDLCRLHLLLPDVATRRDLADAGTIKAVAAAVDSVEFLHLLAALTQADSQATGPSTWGPWKADLVAQLVERTERFLNDGQLGEGRSDFPSAETLDLMTSRGRAIEGRGSTLRVVANDEPLLFSRIAGVMAVSGLDVLDAAAYSVDGMAAAEFVVQSSTGAPVEWEPVAAMVDEALAGRLALSARVARRARTYARYRRRLAASPPRREVYVDNSVSEVATVIDVHAPDTIGLLYRLTQALGEFGLDIRSARVQTLGPEAVDSFYLCDRHGKKILDPVVLAELDLALREAMGEA